MLIDNLTDPLISAHLSNIIKPNKTFASAATGNHRAGLYRGHRQDHLVKQLISEALPTSVKPGAALDTGDCFFDALAQSLNSLGKEPYAVKYLRQICHDYVVALDKKGKGNDNWIYHRFLVDAKRLHPMGEGEATQAAAISYQHYMGNIRFTAEEINEGLGLHCTTAIWGEQDIDGRILSEKLGIKVHIIELLESEQDVILGHQLNGKSITETEIDYKTQDIAHIIVFNNHFVPVLPSALTEITETPENTNHHWTPSAEQIYITQLKGSVENEGVHEIDNNEFKLLSKDEINTIFSFVPQFAILRLVSKSAKEIAESHLLKSKIKEIAEKNIVDLQDNERIFNSILKKGLFIHETFLTAAIKLNSIELIKLLISLGAKGFIANQFSETPLYLATKSNVLLKIIMENGGKEDVNTPCITGDTPLHNAVRLRNSSSVDLLLNNGASDSIDIINLNNEKPIHCLIHDDGKLNSEILSILENYNATQDKKFKIYLKYCKSLEKEKKRAEESINQYRANLAKGQKGIATDKKFNDIKEGIIPICVLSHASYHFGYLNHLQKIPRNMPTFFKSMQDSAGNTQLHAAVRAGNKKLVERLVEKFPYLVKCPNNDGFLPLHNATSTAKLDIIKLLINLEDLFKPNKYGDTPLHRAALSGHVETMRYITKGYRFSQLTYEASILKTKTINILNYKNETPLDMAYKNNSPKLIKYLEEELGAKRGKDVLKNELDENINTRMKFFRF